MKHFGKNRPNKRLIWGLEMFFLTWRPFLRIVQKLLRRGRPAIVLVDGLNIGDAVLLRPLILAILKQYGETHNVVVVAGSFGKQIYADFLHRICLVELQFLWSHLPCSPRYLFLLLKGWWRLLGLNTEIAMETRGDFRSIVWTALACPNARLVGFDFTGGRRLLTDTIPDDGEIAHLFEHLRRLGAALGLELHEQDIRMRTSLPAPFSQPRRVGVALTGLQEMRKMPLDIGVRLLEELTRERGEAELWYIMAPEGDPLTKETIAAKWGNQVQVFIGDFSDYFNFLQTLSCYIGIDSGGGHLCALFGVPSVVIFGMHAPAFCSPLGGHPLLCVEGGSNLYCRPCAGKLCTNLVLKKCLRNIDFTAIRGFVRAIIKNGEKR